MAARSQQSLECSPRKARCTDYPPNANVNKHWRLETSTRLDGIDSFDEMRRMIAPTVISPGEDGKSLLWYRRRLTYAVQESFDKLVGHTCLDWFHTLAPPPARNCLS